MIQLLLKNWRVILASASPRRKNLLEGMGIPFELMLRDCDENYPDSMRAEEVPEFLARKKSKAYTDVLRDDTLLITADTIVVLDGSIIEKPIDEKDATQLLKRLSGNTHTVISGVCLTTKKHQKSFSAYTKVRFKKLHSEEIAHYIKHYQPFDKAGAYGIQEWIGYIGVEHIEGSFFNVMGLPTQHLYHELVEFLSDKK